MPELPEVHTISTDLHNHVKDYYIVNIAFGKGYLVYPDNETFKDSVVGQKIVGVERVAKNILIRLENNLWVGIHLAMTGRVLLRDEEHKLDPWTKAIFKIKKHDDIKHIRFADMRMFGKVVLYNGEELEDLKNKYGPEITNKNLNSVQFLDLLKSKRTNVKNVLLDQDVISGLGNIYATDALFLAKIHPETPTSEITLEMADNLLESAREVVNEGISDRGSTLPDRMYVDIFGNEGSHQEHFKVYMRNYCTKCGNKVEYKKINGRGTYFCPNCQPANS